MIAEETECKIRHPSNCRTVTVKISEKKSYLKGIKNNNKG
jgi:hypothetical protein